MDKFNNLYEAVIDRVDLSHLPQNEFTTIYFYYHAE